MKTANWLLLCALWMGVGIGRAAADPGTVLSHQKISDTAGNFTGVLDNGDSFAWSVANLGDLDGDGVGANPPD